MTSAMQHSSLFSFGYEKMDLSYLDLYALETRMHLVLKQTKRHGEKKKKKNYVEMKGYRVLRINIISNN